MINRKAPEGEYICCWSDFEFLPGVFEAIARLNRAGYLVFVFTNQRGIALRRMTNEAVVEIHRRMRAALEKAGAPIEAVFICPHGIEDQCECRKPKPGMLLEARSRYGVDLTRSIVIGDRESDLEAGRAVGAAVYQVGPRTSLLDLISSFA
ncbi:MAG: HAD family hydrolase [Myxococcales bacterium]|nr:HAD family hydrolase [Myxococcales bacterium]